jgi:hypothetical protein
MAENGTVIRGIDWHQVFPFTHIFRSFRVAIHMSKLLLGLALLLTIFLGGKILDSLWTVHSRAVPGEVQAYSDLVKGKLPVSLSAWRQIRESEADQELADYLMTYKVAPDLGAARAQAEKRDGIAELKAAILDARDTKVRKLDDDRAKADGSAQDAFDAKQDAPDAAVFLDNSKANNANDHDAKVAEVYKDAAQLCQQVEQFKNIGLFEMFFGYEIGQIGSITNSVLQNKWMGDGSITDGIYNFVAVGPIWLMTHHTLFFILFFGLFLFAWSLFGGAISRIAAVHIARDDKISLRQAMNFAVGKMVSFASAPVIPLIFVLGIGLFITAVAFVIDWGVFLGTWIGAPILGAATFLALIAGFVMTLVLLGTAGGFNLMYPTIAVEGTDSFDAISRSFSYVYSRPWQMTFFTFVALIYGAITFLFVRLFIWLMLLLTHHFIGMGVYHVAPNSMPMLNAMWPSPTTTSGLTYSVDYTALTGPEKIGAFLMQAWNMLAISVLGGFGISLYFSSNTIIYFLMRMGVELTEMDDVYMEQSDDELEAAVVETTVSITGSGIAPPAEVGAAGVPATESSATQNIPGSNPASAE